MHRKTFILMCYLATAIIAAGCAPRAHLSSQAQERAHMPYLGRWRVDLAQTWQQLPEDQRSGQAAAMGLAYARLMHIDIAQSGEFRCGEPEGVVGGRWLIDRGALLMPDKPAMRALPEQRLARSDPGAGQQHGAIWKHSQFGPAVRAADVLGVWIVDVDETVRAMRGLHDEFRAALPTNSPAPSDDELRDDIAKAHSLVLFDGEGAQLMARHAIGRKRECAIDQNDRQKAKGAEVWQDGVVMVVQGARRFVEKRGEHMVLDEGISITCYKRLCP